MDDLKVVELVVRKDPKVVEQCLISGIAAEDMHKVYCDRMLCFFLDLGLKLNEAQPGPSGTMIGTAAMSGSNRP